MDSSSNSTSPKLGHIVIRTAPAGGGQRVTDRVVGSGSTLEVWAAGYDEAGNYIADVDVSWSGSGAVAGRLSPPSGKTTTFVAGSVGVGIIMADDSAGHVARSGRFTVTPQPQDGAVARGVQGAGAEDTGSSATAKSASCVVCRENILPATQCPRCGSWNANLPDLKRAYFSGVWGFMSFLLILPPLLMIMPRVYSAVNDVIQPIASVRLGGPIALLISFVIAFYMYTLRDVLYQYTLTRGFQKKPGPSLLRMALMFFVVAIVLGFTLGFAVTTKDTLVSASSDVGTGFSGVFVPGTISYLLFKLVMTGCLIFIFVFLSLSAGAMAAYEYGKYIGARRPAPIFLNEELLLRVVLKSVREHLEIDEIGSEVAGSREASVIQRGGDPGERLSISQMKRCENAGIALTLQNEGELAERGDVVVREDRTWQVETDPWGHLTSVEEKGFRLTKLVEESLPPVDTVRVQILKLVGPQADLKLTELERLRGGGMSLRFLQEEPSRLREPGKPKPRTEWLVEADAEGRITKIREEPRP